MQVQKLTFWIAASLTLLAMTSGVAVAAINIPFTINLSENVTVTGTPRIAVDVGGNPRFANYTSGSGTNALVFTLSPTIGDVDLDGVTLSSSIELNGGTIKDAAGNDATLTFTPPNTAGIKINYPSLGMDFTNGATGRYTLNGTVYNSLSSFLTASGGTFARNSIATYYDSTGTLQTASANTPRFDYDPVTHAPKGILMEESRTNLLLQSTSFSASWVPNLSPTISYNAAMSPDGTTNATTITASTTGSGFYQTRTTTAGTTYTESVYLKLISGSSTSIRIGNDVGGFTGNIAINPQTMTITAQGASVLSSSISNVGNGWHRVTVSWTAGGSSNVFIIYNNTNSAIVLAAWGAQLEQGTFATSYIPTTTAAVARAEDSLTVPAGSWYHQAAGGFYNDVAWVSSSGVNYPMFFRVDDTTSNHRWDLFYNQSGNSLSVDAYNGGAAQGNFSSASAGIAGTKKVAAAQSANDANAAFDGVLKTLDTSWAPPVVTQLTLKGSGANKWHKALKYYPLRVTDPQLQLMTQ